MPEQSLARDSLVIYKGRAARVNDIDDKRITIVMREGDRLRVRPKDVTLLHPGPLKSFTQLNGSKADSEALLTAWELLAGGETNLREIVDLAFDNFTPAAAWAVWQMLDDGLYFKGTAEQITVQTRDAVTAEKGERESRRLAQAQWDAFIRRAEQGELNLSEDESYLQEVVALALGQREDSTVLRALGREQTPENAHDFLLQAGYWDVFVNPYPARAGVPMSAPQISMSPLPDEQRRDLTHLRALAIDDEGNQDPDDAISWQDGRLWVHVADVAALIEVDSPADLEARARGANLYLPEKTVTMLPGEATRQLGLGLASRSPALSIGMEVKDDGSLANVQVEPTWVEVTRLSYEDADRQLQTLFPAELLQAAAAYRHKRARAGAIEIQLPEVRVRVQSDTVSIVPIRSLASRDLVREAMLMAGEAAAIFARTNDIAIPYTSQPAPVAELPDGRGMAEMFATRKLLKPGRQSTSPDIHSGLGMAVYAQVTSPLRRYNDLVIHQQLRSYLRGRPLLSDQEILARIGATDGIQRDLRRLERISRLHWTLIFLLQNPQWQGEAIVVERHGRRHSALLPDLDLQTDLYLPRELPLNSELLVEIQQVQLPYLQSKFTVVGSQQDP